MKDRVAVVIIGAGPYGLSLAAHLAAKGIECRIFGEPMQFWSRIASAGEGRFLKSYCFGTNLSAPEPGWLFADYNRPRGLETFEPCSMGNFVAYGRWFQSKRVDWVEQTDVNMVSRVGNGFEVALDNGERLLAARVVVATGLAGFESLPAQLAALPAARITHTASMSDFRSFAGKHVAVVGAGQSALEAAALLHEYGATPELFVREDRVLWHNRVIAGGSFWKRIRSPITGLGTGPKAWLLTRFPGGMHGLPDGFRTEFVKRHLPAEGAWWVRDRVEGRVPIHTSTSVVDARAVGHGVHLTLRETVTGQERETCFDDVVAGTGYRIDVEKLCILEAVTRQGIRRIEGSPKLDAAFQSSVPGLYFVGPHSAMSFGPLFRFVVGADYTARTLADHVAHRVGAR